MSRKHNKDYYSAGGTDVEDGSITARSKAKFASQSAKLRHDAPVNRGQIAAPRAAPAGRTQAMPMKPAPKAPPRPMPAAEKHEKAPDAVIHEFIGKPRHGKKRRSSKKRHEVEVLHELAAEGSYHAGTQEETHAPAATVSTLRPHLRVTPEKAEDHGPTTAPPTVQDVASLFKRAGGIAKSAINLGIDFVKHPLLLARMALGRHEKA